MYTHAAAILSVCPIGLGSQPWLKRSLPLHPVQRTSICMFHALQFDHAETCCCFIQGQRRLQHLVMSIFRKYHLFGGMETFRRLNSAELSISKSSAAFINPWPMNINLQDFSEALGGSAPSGVTIVGCQGRYLFSCFTGKHWRSMVRSNHFKHLDNNQFEWKIMEVVRCSDVGMVTIWNLSQDSQCMAWLYNCSCRCVL